MGNADTITRLNQNEILWELLISRNKLIEDLMIETITEDKMFQKAKEMRMFAWEHDKEIWTKGEGVKI